MVFYSTGGLFGLALFAWMADLGPKWWLPLVGLGFLSLAL